jgi:hypothetical protein
MGGLIHILLDVAVVFVVIRLICGRPVVRKEKPWGTGMRLSPAPSGFNERVPSLGHQ